MLAAAAGGQAKDGWRIAGVPARSTQEPGQEQDSKHWSGGVAVAVPVGVGTAFAGDLKSFSGDLVGHEGRFSAVWVNVAGGLVIGSVYLWTGEGWSVRNLDLM